MSLNSSLPSRSPHALPLSLGPLDRPTRRPGPEKVEGSAAHIYTPHQWQRWAPHNVHVLLELRIGPALKQASALVRDGGTHTPEEKENDTNANPSQTCTKCRAVVQKLCETV